MELLVSTITKGKELEEQLRTKAFRRVGSGTRLCRMGGHCEHSQCWGVLLGSLESFLETPRHEVLVTIHVSCHSIMPEKSDPPRLNSERYSKLLTLLLVVSALVGFGI